MHIHSVNGVVLCGADLSIILRGLLKMIAYVDMCILKKKNDMKFYVLLILTKHI